MICGGELTPLPTPFLLFFHTPCGLMRQWLTHAATDEKLELQSLLASTELDSTIMDKRVLRGNGMPPTLRDHYFLSFQNHLDDPFAPAIWRSFAPKKCEFFLWLLHRERLSTKSRLHHCNTQATG
jgi:hypothetical protein